MGKKVFHNLLSYWDFGAQPFLGFTKNGVKMKKKKHPVYGSPVGENVVLEVVDARGQRRMGQLIQANRRATLTEITTR